MIEKIISRIVPEGYDYRDAWWFAAMGKKDEKKKKRTLFIVFSAGTALPCAAAFFVSSGKNTAALAFLGAALVLISVVSVLFPRFRLRVISSMVLISSAVSFLFIASVPALHDLSLSLFLLFPFFAHQTRGTLRGSILSALFFSAAMTVLVLLPGDPVPMWSFLCRAVSFAVAFSVSLLAELHQQGFVRDAVTKVLYDDATLLPNRSVLMKSVPRHGRSLFSILHVENFSDLGVLFGYDLSDKILEHITDCLREMMGAYGFHVYKLKGHEFGILLNDWSLDESRSEVAIYSICTALQNMPIVWFGKELRVFVRAGCVIVDDVSRHDFISRADIALRQGDRQKRPVTVHSDTMSIVSSVRSSNELYSILVTNRNTNSFKVYFQPVVDAVTLSVVWHECLLRVKGADESYHSPLPYLAVARSTGFDRYITEYVIGEACKAIAATGGSFSINMSYSDILRPEVVEIVTEKMASVEDGEGRLIIEILECEDIESTELLRGNIARMKKAGCRIAIDDFGSGYSNFAKLVELDIDIIKIDGSLVQKCVCDETTESLIRGIAHFCRQWGKEVVAEYVDCAHLADMMQGMGVNYLQGYHYGTPEEKICVA